MHKSRMRLNTGRALLAAALMFLLICPALFAQQEKPEKQRLNMMNFFAAGLFRALPGGFMWLPDESGFIYTDRGTYMLWNIEEGKGKKLFAPNELEAELMKDRKARENEGMGNTNSTGRFNRSAMTLSEDGSKLLGFMDNDVYVYDIASGEAKFITNDAGIEEFQAFSPDGTKVAYTKDHNIYVLNLADGKETKLTDNGGNDEIWNGVGDWVYEEEISLHRAFWWSPNSDKIAYLQFDTTPVPYFLIVDHLNRVPDPEKQKFAMVGGPNSIVRLGVVDINNAETTWVDSGEDTDVYIYEVNWNHSGNAFIYRWMSREQNRIELRLADPNTGASKLATADESEDWVNARVNWFGAIPDLVFLPDDSFIWLSERSGFFHAYHFAADGTLIKQLTDGDWAVEQIETLASDGTLYFTATAEHPLVRNLYRVKIDGTGFERLTPAEGNNATTVSPNGTYFIATNSALDRQRRISLHKTGGEELAELATNVNPQLDKFNFNYSKIVELKAEDGTPLFGALTLPPDFDETKKYPVLVYVYGGPAVQLISDSWGGGVLFMHQLFAAEDYIVWTLDNRGSFGRGHDFEKVIYKKMGDIELKDQVVGVDFLKTLPYVDADRIGITGGSYGGYMTLMALFKYPDIFKVGVAQSPGVDNRHYDTLYTERYLGQLDENAEGYAASDASKYSGGLKGKLLITHGMMDNNVHVQQVFQQIDALIKAGKDFEIMLYPRERHGIGTPYRRMHSMRGMMDFFEEYLKGETK